ncbi:hypothetical protein HYT53_03530 [Candidatus Woesearchaeota archaeon]|nr:hypothetical protein [Candidatus Woesearchaeota archaeon]
MPRFKKGSQEAKDWAAKMRAKQGQPKEQKREDIGLPPDDKPSQEQQKDEGKKYLGHCSDCGADIYEPKPAQCPECEAPL